MFKDKNFYKTMISIALPIAIQNLISTSLNMVDTMMIGRLGKEQIAAVGLANQYFFLYILLLFGIYSGSAIFTSQFWGKKDVINIRRVLGLCLISGGILGLIFTTGALTLPKHILSIFSKDTQVINLGSRYLRIVCLSYIVTAISFAYGFSCRSVGQAKLPMIVSAISLGCNTLLNYILIFGMFGFPRLEIEGAALATLISRIIEVILLLVIIYKKEYVLAARFKQMLDLSKEFVIKIYKTAYPVILNEAFWSLGMTMYSIAYARISTEAIASVQIANTIQNVFLVLSMGLANACAVMIGNQIGANNKQKGIEYAKHFSILAVSIGIILGLTLYLLSPFILSIFNVSNTVKVNTSKIITVMALFMSTKMFTSVLIVGILRSGGDTKYSLLLEMGCVWLIGVPLAFIGAFVWKLPIYLVVALVSSEEVVKSLIGIPRIISKKWINNVVEDL